MLSLAMLLWACEENICEDPEYESSFSAKTCLGGAADELASLSPSLQKDLQKLEKGGWKIRYDPGGGSYAILDDKIIVIDSVFKNQPTGAVQTLAHEVGHANSSFSFDYSSKSAFVASALTDEGAAVMNGIKVRREVLENGGPDISLVGNPANHAKYNAAYDQYLNDGDMATACRTIGAEFGENEKSSVTGQTYNDYYGDWYDRHYKKSKWKYTQSGWRAIPF
jgi:type VI secretion system secreted protein VgrG